MPTSDKEPGAVSRIRSSKNESSTDFIKMIVCFIEQMNYFWSEYIKLGLEMQIKVASKEWYNLCRIIYNILCNWSLSAIFLNFLWKLPCIMIIIFAQDSPMLEANFRGTFDSLFGGILWETKIYLSDGKVSARVQLKFITLSSFFLL